MGLRALAVGMSPFLVRATLHDGTDNQIIYDPILGQLHC